MSALPTTSELRGAFHAAVTGHNAAMAGLGIGFLGAFVVMVITAFTADHIKKSKYYSTGDSDLERAYDWSMWAAIISGLVTVGCVIGAAYLIKGKLNLVKPAALSL